MDNPETQYVLDTTIQNNTNSVNNTLVLLQTNHTYPINIMINKIDHTVPKSN